MWNMEEKKIQGFEQAVRVLPLRLRQEAMALPEEQRARVEELRLRWGRPMAAVLPEGERPLGGEPVTGQELEQLLELASRASFHTVADQLRRGYLTVEGGHRVGLCGTAVVRDGELRGLRRLSSAAVRVARQAVGAARPVSDRLLRREGTLYSTLILAPPGAGKTTLLRDLIRAACAAPQAEVEFLVGGTQANQTVISAALRPYQGALCAQTGHINVHETGAIEATGHKVLPLPSQDGKITPKQVEQFCAVHWADPTREHIVQPGMVYLSQPTETGLLYTRTELEGFRAVCDRYGMYLYIDGARCGYGLAAPENDVDLTDLARLTDVFYIGGTKVGALFGEAVVISSPALQRDFRYCIKRHGGMLAKGRLLGLQFEALFEDGLYLQLGRHGVEQALRIREACLRRGLPLHFDSRTNQQFPVLTRAQRERLEEKYAFTFWEQLDDDRAVVRFCASWATDPAAVDALTADLLSLP